MSSETITRNDLANILNEVLPFSFTEFRNQSGTITVANSTLVQAHSETFTDGSWLILTTFETLSGGSATANAGQNRILKDGALVYSHKSLADTSIVNTNFYVLKNANNTTITLEAFQVTGNSQSQEWTFTAIRIGDKFAEPSADYIVEQGTDGIWTYTKWNNGSYEAVYVGTVNMQAGSAMGGGYSHQTTSVLTPPSFSQTVKSLHGSANGAVLFSYVGHANDYSTYWWNASSTAVSNVAVRLEMHGTWK